MRQQIREAQEQEVVSTDVGQALRIMGAVRLIGFALCLYAVAVCLFGILALIGLMFLEAFVQGAWRPW